jgi:hypothetical protein
VLVRSLIEYVKMLSGGDMKATREPSGDHEGNAAFLGRSIERTDPPSFVTSLE